MEDKKLTTDQALLEWDANNPIWSVEMGGIGPDYEQVIQRIGFELLRAMLETPCDWEKASTSPEYWKEYRDSLEEKPYVKAVISDTQPTGAQFGAAMNLAGVFNRQGYAKGLASCPEGRHILVKKDGIV